MVRRAGFTLVELMVSMGILLVITVYLTEMLINQSEAYAVVDQVTEAQQNVRTVSSLVERDIRATGLLAPEGASVCGLDRAQGSDILFVTDASAVDDPAGALNFRSASVVPGTYDGSGDSVALQLGSVVLDQATYDTDGDGNADSDFLATGGPGPSRNGGVIVVDRNNPGRGASCGIVQDVATGANQITVDFDLANDGVGSPLQAHDPLNMAPQNLRAIPAHVYRVQNDTLQRDGLVLADDVEDLQVSYFFDDANPNGQVDGTAETPGAGGAPPYFPPAEDHTTLREVQVWLVARTRAEDLKAVQGPAGAEQGEFQTTANRQDPGNPADGFRRRVHTVSVRPRNVGRRPLVEY